MGNTTLLILI